MLVENDQEKKSQPKGKRRRRVWISIGIILALLIIFHRPILLASIHWFAVRAAAKENLNLDLNPRASGILSVSKLQLPSGQNWSGVTGTTRYTDRNLFLRDLAPGELTKIPLVNLDASNIRAHTLGFKIDVAIDEASLGAQGQLMKEARSLRVQAVAAVHNLSLASLQQFGVEGMAGKVENVSF